MPATAPTTRVAAQMPARNFDGLRDRLTKIAGLASASGRMQLLSNNATGFIGNNAAGFVSKNAAGVISNGGAARHLLALPDAEAGEHAAGTTPRPDGATIHHFVTDETATRDVTVSAAGKPVQEERTTGIRYHANGEYHSGTTVRTIYAETGATIAVLRFDETYDDTGRFLGVTHAPSTFKDPTSGIDIEIAVLTIDAVAGTGSFTLRYKHLGLTETGTLTALGRQPNGAVAFALLEPLEMGAGTSTVTDKAAHIVFSRTYAVTHTSQTVNYDLGEGMSLALARASGKDPFTGTAHDAQGTVGTANLTRAADGTLSILVTPTDGSAPIQVNDHP